MRKRTPERILKHFNPVTPTHYHHPRRSRQTRVIVIVEKLCVERYRDADVDDVPGSVIPAPLVTGVNSSSAVSMRSFSAGEMKSILNASFFSRGAFGLAVFDVSAMIHSKFRVSPDRMKQKRNRAHNSRLQTTFLSFQCSGPAQFFKKF
jgi:hypothetical protein